VRRRPLPRADSAHGERIREDGTTFLIVPGRSSTGYVISQHDHYLVVRKDGEGGAVARARDPRKEEP
jgi:hypothetical protein